MAEEGDPSFALMKNGTYAYPGSITLHHELLGSYKIGAFVKAH
jgi:hypothetical protein